MTGGSSVRHTRAALAEIARRNPRLNAFTQVDADGALAAAAQSDERRARGALLGPLDGLTLAVKDNIDVAGLATTAGMATRRGRVALADAFVVAQLRAAGMVVLGKLNMHEAALGTTNDNPHYGRCINPLRPRAEPPYTPGGSSGGSACAVAAGLCDVALGSDTMGSVRVPAAYCGVLGFKGSFGAASTRGSVACGYALDHIGPLARRLSDLRHAWQAVAVFDPACADARAVAVQPLPARPRWLAPADVRALGATAEVAAAYDAALAALRARGDSVAAIDLSGYDFGRARRAGLVMVEADLLHEHAHDWKSQRENFSPALAKMLAWCEKQPASAYAAAARTVAAARVEVQRWWQHGDVMLLPTTPQVAFPFGGEAPANAADFTSIANMAGVPALSLPLPCAPGALPAALQAIGPQGSDAALLALDWAGVIDSGGAE
jgi:aspartyl-tRNA(Asn)/glutamyl-tRNA(Gln) amidotransferase subunit A